MTLTRRHAGKLARRDCQPNSLKLTSLSENYHLLSIRR
ncbi:hypothetical protein GMOD_00003183 [Pyrenophora seminiperda CCB06]|uniref:Uncharacterized protein n=1 Tax=Pyrenophora seminiperda CCB06 TaxID=1302712 RepID=A0A3M7M445_9PLEO|nr:hypothetical protein GMOD_00003183 [Pyrenophora seminiperda CCB06]